MIGGGMSGGIRVMVCVVVLGGAFGGGGVGVGMGVVVWVWWSGDGSIWGDSMGVVWEW